MLIAFSTWFLGYIDTVMIVNTGLDVDDQQELGTAIGCKSSNLRPQHPLYTTNTIY